MTADPETLAAYAAHAADYADRFRQDQPDPSLAAFIAALPLTAHVLDLGCGPANASAFLRAAGHHPDPVDASPEMVALANARHAIGARLATFDDIDAVARYDGVWANFSLLHAPRKDLPRHLAALARALRPGGLLHLGMKTGDGEIRDRLGRHYTFVSVAELSALVEAAGFTLLSTETGEEVGLAGSLDPFVILTARRPKDPA
jgi:SAM-dependent methyltransferase